MFLPVIFCLSVGLLYPPPSAVSELEICVRSQGCLVVIVVIHSRLSRVRDGVNVGGGGEAVICGAETLDKQRERRGEAVSALICVAAGMWTCLGK